MRKPPSGAPIAGGHVSGQSNNSMSQPAHSLTSEQVLIELRANASSGLSADEAARRLKELGSNELKRQKGVQPMRIFLEQIFNAMTLVLLMALGASFGIHAWIEGGILGGIIVLNIFIGFFQTLQAERTIDSLRNLGSPTCNVFRDGKTINIQTSDVVPGDIVDLTTGSSVPADIRLIHAVNLEADEALLTGESGRGRGVVFATGMYTEIGLIASALQGDDFLGKGVEWDSQTAQHDSVTKVWSKAAKEWLGRFLGLTVGTPLQKKLAQLFLWLLAFAIVCAIVVLGANKFDTHRDVILYAVTTAVGTIPVSLLLVLTVTMAAGTKKMLERHVIVRNLSSLEALGGVTNICSDKTGTITQGRMIVRKAWLPGCGTYSVETTNEVYNPTVGKVSFNPAQPRDVNELEKQPSEEEIIPRDEVAKKPFLQNYLNIASLANLASVEQEKNESTQHAQWTARGAPTEIAIEVFASRFGCNRIQLSQGPDAKWSHIGEFPFDSDVKKMSSLYLDTTTQETHIFTKGAVERVVDICDRFASTNEIKHLDSVMKANIIENMEALASQGLRVLALAHKHSNRSVSSSDFTDGIAPNRERFERNLVFHGLIGIYDPPRPESKDSVLMCQGAGIIVHMLTGDHPQTARAIATEVCILPSLDEMRMLPADVALTIMMTAQEFDALSDDQIDALPQLPLVVARCAPSTKVRMIEALHRRNRYVAMTGDGVNDSPSLKRADIGIAMGSGSDVAKESSDIVLTDDNFTSILNAIEEGRRIFDNIQKFILHVLAANIGFVISLLTGLAFKDGANVSVFLLTPVEIIWMLLGTGAFSETGLGFETAVPDILNRPPQDLRYGIFTPEFMLDMVIYGILMAGCVLGSFTTVIFGFGDGNLGINCNNAYSSSCHDVFRARATAYTAMTCIFLLFSWELIDFRRSFFDMHKGARAWAAHLWGNKFLFFAITIVFFVVFPTLYIPRLNTVVFMHTGIDWEWGVVFVAVIVFVVGAEAWKWTKRVYFRRRAQRGASDSEGGAA
ncbi:sodium transport atpase 5 [Trichoderma arundinaceum]|uniref:P-type Na(+) transporter n=1 Tax=Trichoderma arundinaceum TaxID=490622 RepID=A0A395NB28_TRIAR|nr:sodium transport atpase 5 [Trichoderma arundinaceum]